MDIQPEPSVSPTRVCWEDNAGMMNDIDERRLLAALFIQLGAAGDCSSPLRRCHHCLHLAHSQPIRANRTSIWCFRWMFLHRAEYRVWGAMDICVVLKRDLYFLPLSSSRSSHSHYEAQIQYTASLYTILFASPRCAGSTCCDPMPDPWMTIFFQVGGGEGDNLDFSLAGCNRTAFGAWRSRCGYQKACRLLLRNPSRFLGANASVAFREDDIFIIIFICLKRGYQDPICSTVLLSLSPFNSYEAGTLSIPPPSYTFSLAPRHILH